MSYEDLIVGQLHIGAVYHSARHAVFTKGRRSLSQNYHLPAIDLL